MARPRNDAGGASAKERMQEAFWGLLEEKPFDQMTLAELSRKAHVNHNTFYYHYENLNDAAVKMLRENLIDDFPHMMVASLEDLPRGVSTLIDDPGIRLRFKRMCLLAGPHSSAWLMLRLKEAIIDLWFDAFEADKAKLTWEDEAMLTFVISGMLAVLGEFGSEKDPRAFMFLTVTEVIQVNLKTLRDILDRCKKDVSVGA